MPFSNFSTAGYPSWFVKTRVDVLPVPSEDNRGIRGQTHKIQLSVIERL